MGPALVVISTEEIDEDDLNAVVESLGGVVEPAGARLDRGGCYVEILNSAPGPIEPEDMALYETKLGGPPRTQLVLDMSKDPGTDRLAFELVDALARQWTVVVDNDYGSVFTIGELRARAEAGESSLFLDT